MERAPGTDRGYYLSKGTESKLANKSLGANKSRLKASRHIQYILDWDSDFFPSFISERTNQYIAEVF